MPCPLCERLERIRAGTDPSFIREFQESYAVLADSKQYAGWCTLILKGHEEHLVHLPVARQRSLFGDVAKMAAAVQKACHPRRINHECLGNVTAHVHWHVIPRYEGDPQPRATVWVRPEAEREVPLPEAERDDLIGRLRKALGA